MKRRNALKPLIVLTLLSVIAAACGPAPAATQAPPIRETVVIAQTSAPQVQTVVVPGAPRPAATMVPAPSSVPRGTMAPPGPTLVPSAEAGGQPGVPGLPSIPYAQDRMIVKSGEMDLLVVDTDVAIGGVTQVAIDYGGYILSGRSWFEGNFKFAQITLGVPSEQYESVLGRLRGLGITVLRETSAGVDVTDEYVDLDSRLRNLEVQAERLRAFMADAKNIQEAITVSQSLSNVEDQIEQIKGRMNYLGGRAAVSTITVNLQPQRPTPTPTLTPSVTPTPTSTPTSTPTQTPTPSPTPTDWEPGRTVEKALGTAGMIWQGLTDLLIWLLVIGGPFLLMLVAILLVMRWRIGRRPRVAP